MSLPISYVTAGPWGPGTGSPLEAAQADGNFWAVASALAALQAALPSAARGIASISLTGTVLSVTATDGSLLLSAPLPVAEVAARGPWAAGTVYLASQVVSHRGVAVMATLDHTAGSDWWADYRAGRWRVVAGAACPSPTAVLPQPGERVFEVPAGLALTAGLPVTCVSDEMPSLRLDGTVTDYAAGGDGRWWLTVAVIAATALVAGAVTGWTITPGGGGSGGGGWSRVTTVTGAHAATAADAGALLTGADSVSLPAAGSMPPGASIAVTGWGVVVSDGAATVTVDGGAVWLFTVAPTGWTTRRLAPLGGGYAYDHGADRAFVFAPSAGVIHERQYTSPAWGTSYGMAQVELTSAPAAVWRWISGGGLVEVADGIGVGMPALFPGAVTAAAGYRVAGAPLGLRHLDGVNPALTLSAGYGLRHDGTQLVAAALPLATGAEGIPVLPSYTVATLPAAAAHAGGMVRVSDGDDGAACLAVSDGTAWRRVALGPAVAGSA